MKIGILGAGVYAIALSDILIDNGNKVCLWTKFEEEKENLLTSKSNINLGNYRISDNINVTTSIKEIMKNELIIFAVPANVIKDTALAIKDYVKNQHFCIASKGIFENQILIDIVKDNILTDNIGVISGPTFAIDIVNKCPIGFSVASFNVNTNNIIFKALKNNRVAINVSNDVIAVSLCGSLKNIFAIGCGIIDGLSFPISTQCLLITKAVEEIIEVINYFGGNKENILSYAGIGDLILTCTSNKSRNYSLGIMIGKKQDKKDINNFIETTTIEGIAALKQMKKIINNNNLKIPIIKCIYEIIFNEKNINQILKIIAQ